MASGCAADGRRVCICTTTINVPLCLEAFAANALQHGHAPTFVIAGDLKTPPECAEFCGRLAAQFPSMRFVYLGPPEQVPAAAWSPTASPGQNAFLCPLAPQEGRGAPLSAHRVVDTLIVAQSPTRRRVGAPGRRLSRISILPSLQFRFHRRSGTYSRSQSSRRPSPGAASSGATSPSSGPSTPKGRRLSSRLTTTTRRQRGAVGTLWVRGTTPPTPSYPTLRGA